MIVIVVLELCAAGLAAWRWWLIHDDEPVDDDEPESI